jgi:catechol 2,3-dioxygenase-like lactoylglutathione lyase family enzyme
VPDFAVTRAGAILAVSDFAASLRFSRDQLGPDEVALYDDPPYATLSRRGADLAGGAGACRTRPAGGGDGGAFFSG